MIAIRGVFVACVVALAASTPATAQTEAVPPSSQPSLEEEHALEAYPDDITNKIGRRYASMRLQGWEGPAATTRGVFATLLRWPAALPRINVCFFGGTPAQRSEVIDIASLWTKIPNARVPLYFGEPGTPIDCTGSVANDHIRVSFVPDRSIWSAVGKQSVVDRDIFHPGKPSMNFGFSRALGKDKIRRAILHEFGHALGLEHEHQNPKAKCWPDEFDRAVLVDYLKSSRGWSQDQVEANMTLLHKPGLLADAFDAASVMIYDFPARYYKRKLESPCFSDATPELSKGDIAMIAKIYPSSQQESSELQAKTNALWKQRLQQLPKTREFGSPEGPLRSLIDKYLTE